MLEYASRKRETKQVDLIVANDVTLAVPASRCDTNVASFVTADGVQSYPLETKDGARVAHRRVWSTPRLSAAPPTGRRCAAGIVQWLTSAIRARSCGPPRSSMANSV